MIFGPGCLRMTSNEPLKISIAMATYNGGKYLQEQLDSLLNQTRLPDELVITDDCSTDDTLEIIKAIQKETPFRIILIENKARLGFVQNFSKAISLCSGDLIFMSDQDDVWLPSKIERVVEIANERPDIQVYINDALITFEDLSTASGSMIERQLSEGLSLDTHLTNGCQTAVRKRFASMMMPVPEFCSAHDIWFHDMARQLGAKLIIPEVLQYWRRHEESTCGFPAVKPSFESRMKRRVRLLFDGFETPVFNLQEKKTTYLCLLKIISEQHVITDKTKIIMAQESLENEIIKIDYRLSIFQESGLGKLIAVTRSYFQGNYSLEGGFKAALKDLMVSGIRIKI